MRCFLTVLFCAFSVISFSVAPPAKKNWTNSFSGNKMFIANSGQLTGIPGVEGKALYGIDNAGEQIVFTNLGINYIYFVTKEPRWNPFSIFRKQEKEREEEIILETKVISMKWEGSNPNVTVVAEEEQKEFYYYRNPSANEPYKCKEYKKITYKNLYDGIDVEYVFHKTTGFKYTIIVHPGADASKIAMVYSGHSKVIPDGSGGILITTDNGTIIDHAPLSFDAVSKKEITSAFLIKKNTITFSLGDYDKTRDLIIDPWTISPGFTTANKAYDVVRNKVTGDLFVYGGYPPYELKKYNSAGALQWTYGTSPFYISGSTFYGDVTIDPAGDVYVANGCCTGQIMKLNGSTAAVIWTKSAVPEPWRMVFDVTNNRLVAAGYISSTAGENVMTINPATGATITMAVIIGPTNAAEVRSMTMTPSGNILLLHLSAFGSGSLATNRITLNTPALVNIHDVVDGYLLTEEGAYYAVNEFSGSTCPTTSCVHGINAFAPRSTCYYTYDGSTIFKRNMTTGASLGSVVVPGGLTDNVSGIAVDSCGNVYVGTQTGVSQYDSSLVFVSSFPTGAAVYDVIIGAPSEVIACGNGFVTSIFVPTACSSFFAISSPVTCNGLCDGSATAVTSTGTPPYTFSWSTGDTTQTVNALCAGTYTVTATDALGAVSTSTVSITSPAAINITGTSVSTPCGSSAGTATAAVTGGTGSYSYSWSPGGQITSTATGLNPGTYVVTVSDANSCVNLDTVVVGSGPPPAVSLVQSASDCYGGCGLAANSTTVTGTPPYAYAWSNSTSGMNASGLCAGSYTCVVTDFYGCTGTATISVSTAPELILNSTFIHCQDQLPNGQATVLVSGGTPGYSYLWNTSPPQIASTAGLLGPGTYVVVVTDNINCSSTTTVSIPDCPTDTIFIPNVFTPNADGENDFFAILSTAYNSIECVLYNRWGTKIHSWDAVATSWNGTINGKPASDGVYYYIYKAIKFDDTVHEGAGFLQLLRDK